MRTEQDWGAWETESASVQGAVRAGAGGRAFPPGMRYVKGGMKRLRGQVRFYVFVFDLGIL